MSCNQQMSQKERLASSSTRPTYRCGGTCILLGHQVAGLFLCRSRGPTGARLICTKNALDSEFCGKSCVSPASNTEVDFSSTIPPPAILNLYRSVRPVLVTESETAPVSRQEITNPSLHRCPGTQASLSSTARCGWVVVAALQLCGTSCLARARQLYLGNLNVIGIALFLTRSVPRRCFLTP